MSNKIQSNNLADQQNLAARYQRAEYLHNGIFNQKLHFNDAVFPNWIEDSDSFWYERTTKTSTEGQRGKEYRLVDAKATSNELAFNHDVFATALSEAAKEAVDAESLPIDGVKMCLNPLTVSFNAFERCWQFDATSQICSETISIQKRWRVSPEGKQALLTRDFNLWVRDLSSGEERALTRDGTKENTYAVVSSAWGGAGFDPTPFPQALWSPDSQWVFTIQRDTRQVKTLPIVHHIPEDGSLRPQVEETKVAYPGDQHVETYRLVALHVESGRLQPANYRQIPVVCNGHGFFTENMGWWSADSRCAYFVDMERGNKTVRVTELTVATGATRLILEETSETFLSLSQQVDERSTFMPLPDSKELLWWSERSGWAHVYLYDVETGELKNTVTQGDWVVRDICAFDASRREVFLQTGGRNSERDPYYRDLVRVNIDTGEMTTLVESDHDIFLASWKNFCSILAVNVMSWDIRDAGGIAPSGDYAVVTRTRVDEVSVSVLVDREGNECLTLESTDISALPESWRWPEPVKAVAADGETDIYGLVFKPSDFSPEQSYPVISHIYNVPESPYVYKGSFMTNLILNWIYLDAAALAELGFIVVQFDGRGTPWRSKAFHDAHYGNFHAASGLDDHIAGIKQLAKRHSYMDLDRVGIYSCNGGNGSVLGLLQHPEFYKVGVNGDCLHDVRMMSGTLLGDMYEGVLGSEYPSVEEQADQLQGKLLLLHGMLNTMVPPAATFRLVQALMDANKDFDMLLLPTRGHALATNYVVRRTWDYMVQHLMGVEPPKQFHLQAGEAWSGYNLEE